MNPAHVTITPHHIIIILTTPLQSYGVSVIGGSIRLAVDLNSGKMVTQTGVFVRTRKRISLKKAN